MKTVSLTIDITKLNLSEEDKKKSSQSIVSSVIQNVILGYGQQQRGFDEKERRQYYKIADALELAEKENKTRKNKLDLTTLKDDQNKTKDSPNPLLYNTENNVK